jgi:hypothetical protein
MKFSICTYNLEGLTICHNAIDHPDLKEIILSKSQIFIDLLKKIGSDIICLQEYISVFHIKLDEYHRVESGSNVILFKKKFKYIKHWLDPLVGLILELDLGKEAGNCHIFVGTNRLAPLAAGKDKRIEHIKAIDLFAKKKLFVFGGDTNLRKAEEELYDNINDCVNTATITNGFYTLDKKINPYFQGDDQRNIRVRYDRIYHTGLLDCQQLHVHKVPPMEILKHYMYPFGGVSDHFPLEAIMEIS